ncbi:MAG TPA: cupin-like domain-containing protein [Steroidobacteraceae bacterium]|nr:cupin-like domain-containing protein [Steroidobacteraceae bacterium]
MKAVQQIPVLEGCTPGSLPLGTLLSENKPVLLKGLVKEWGLVKAGRSSVADAMNYLRSFYNGKVVGSSYGDPQIAGRLFYNDNYTQLNFNTTRGSMEDVLKNIEAHLNDEQPPTYYIASLTVDACLPGFRQDNDLDFARHGFDPPAVIWIGNRTTASAHYDAPSNIACCAVGSRRFTIFPPDQIFNLYPGPLEPTPGGQAISIVDFKNPDFEKYPRFRDALANAQVAELQAGDAIFIPSMWWHHVEGTRPFNVLVNYWWSTSPKYIPTPMNALYHAMWSLRDRPESEKQAWRNVFEYYVFGSAQRPREHLPEAAHGVLGPVDEIKARYFRAMLINLLNR